MIQIELKKPGQFDGIVAVSGDGILHEVINSVMKKENSDELLKSLTFGIIPSGSGNGLATTILNLTHQKFNVQNAAFTIIKGRSTKMDLTELDLEYHQDEDQKKVYMFNSLSWAFISDVDINSEKCRCIGSKRFTLWGLYRILFVNHYRGTLGFNG